MTIAMIQTMIAATHGEGTKSSNRTPMIRASTAKLCFRVSVIWTSSNGSFTTLLSPGFGQAIDHGARAGSRRSVGFENVGNCRDVPKPRFQDRAVHLGDGQPGDPTRQERLHGHLVGGAQGGRGAATSPAGLVGEGQARGGLEVGGLEGERAQRGPVDGPERLVEPDGGTEG